MTSTESITREGAGIKGRESSVIEPDALCVGAEVIRRREPGGRYEETPLRGVIERIYASETAYVRWSDAVRYVGRGRGDNHSKVKLSALLPATRENVERAEKRLRGRKAQAWIDRAEFYERMAEVREGQDLPEEAKWMRAEASDARRRAQKTSS